MNLNEKASTSKENNVENVISERNAFEKIKTECEEIIQNKIKFDSKLNNLKNLQKKYQDFIKEEILKISELEIKNQEINASVAEQISIRMKIENDIEMICKYIEDSISTSFNKTKNSVHEIDINENLLKFKTNTLNNEIIKHVNEITIQIETIKKDIKIKMKLLNGKDTFHRKNKENKMQYLKNQNKQFFNLETEIQEISNEIKINEALNDKLKADMEMKTAQKLDLENDFKTKQINYNISVRNFENDCLNFDKKIFEMEASCAKESENIKELKKKIENLTTENENQNNHVKEIQNETKKLEDTLSEYEILTENLEKEYNIEIEKLEKFRSKSSEEISSYKTNLENLKNECSVISNKFNNLSEELKIKTDNSNNLKEKQKLLLNEIEIKQNKIKEIKKTIEKYENKQNEIINDYNEELNKLQDLIQQKMEEKEKLILEMEFKEQQITDTKLKIELKSNETTKIREKQDLCRDDLKRHIEALNKEITDLDHEAKKIKNDNEIEIQKIEYTYQDQRQRILEDINIFKEQMEALEKKNKEKFEAEKLELQKEIKKYEFGINELKPAKDNLQTELSRINNEILEITKEQIMNASKREIQLRNSQKEKNLQPLNTTFPAVNTQKSKSKIKQPGKRHTMANDEVNNLEDLFSQKNKKATPLNLKESNKNDSLSKSVIQIQNLSKEIKDSQNIKKDTLEKASNKRNIWTTEDDSDSDFGFSQLNKTPKTLHKTIISANNLVSDSSESDNNWIKPTQKNRKK